jgi:hypothetical protein
MRAFNPEFMRPSASRRPRRGVLLPYFVVLSASSLADAQAVSPPEGGAVAPSSVPAEGEGAAVLPSEREEPGEVPPPPMPPSDDENKSDAEETDPTDEISSEQPERSATAKSTEGSGRVALSSEHAQPSFKMHAVFAGAKAISG